MNLDHLRIFLAVAERLHVTRAAKDLNITQSGASAAVSALERRYGVRLFHRIGRSIALTEEGRVFVEHGQRLVAQVNAVEHALAELSDLKRGSLSLHASPLIANYRLPAVLAEFRSRFPDISVALKIGNDEQILEAVLAGDTAIGFIEKVPDEDIYAAFEIGENPMVIGYSAALAAKAGDAPSLGQLAGLPWVVREEGSSTRQSLMRALSLNGIDPESISIALELPSHEAVRAAIEAGAGVGILPAVVAEAALRSGLVREARVTIFPKRLFAIRRRDRQLSNSENALIETIRSQLAPAA